MHSKSIHIEFRVNFILIPVTTYILPKPYNLSKNRNC